MVPLLPILPVVEPSAFVVIFDFSAVSGIDSSAGSSFLRIAQRLKAAQVRHVVTGLSPAVRRVMAEAGAFGDEFAAQVTELAFWKLSGRHEEGEEQELFKNKPDELRAAIVAAAQNLPALIAKFADPATPYLARPHPGRKLYKDVYAGISRAGEWGGEGDDDGD